MYHNIGEKIKTLASVVCGCGILVCVILGIALIGTQDENSVSQIIGFMTLILGPLLLWIGGLFVYGYGQMIQNTDILVNKLDKIEQQLTGKSSGPADGEEIKVYENEQVELTCPHCGAEHLLCLGHTLADYDAVECPFCHQKIDTTQYKRR